MLFCLLVVVGDEIRYAQEGLVYESRVVACRSQMALEGNGSGVLQPLPSKSLINTLQLNKALWGIVNKRPKADFLRV